MSKPHRSNTLDRLQRFSFGGSRSGSKDRKKDSAASDSESVQNNLTRKSSTRSNSEKTERLRELTEKLKGLSPQVRSPVPKRPNRRLPPSSKSLNVQTNTSGNCKLSDNEKTHTTPAASDDVPTISTTTAYRKIPFKSVSFSQVDFSPIDGKYTRRRSTSNCSAAEPDTPAQPESTSVVVAEQNDLSPSLAPVLSQTIVDSRSLTHPLGKRAQIHSRGRYSATNSRKLLHTHEEPPSISENENVISETEQRTSENQNIESDRNSSEPNCDINKVDTHCDTSKETLSLRSSLDNNSNNLVESTVKTAEKTSSQEQPRSRNSLSSSADKSRKRKGIYITKWPSNIDTTKEFLGVDTPDSIPTIYLQDGTASDAESCWNNLQDDGGTPDEWYNDPFTGPEWPQPANNPTEPSNTPKPLKSSNHLLVRVDSLSESESEHRDYLTSSRPSIYSDKSDFSDCEGNQTTNSPRRYSKRPLRGPYGQMLEAEMKKPDTNKMFSKLYYNKELKFLDDLMGTINNNDSSLKTLESPNITSVPNIVRTRSAGNRSLDETNMKPKDDFTAVQPRTSPQRKIGVVALTNTDNNSTSVPLSPYVRHQRTTSSPSKLEGIVINPKESSIESNLRPMEQNLKSSTECLTTAQQFLENIPDAAKDTRTHIVIELYETERSYVESLQTLVTKYLQPLKSPENAAQLDPAIVDEIFYQIPALLSHHEIFLEELHKRLDQWDVKQKIGDIFIDVFTKPSVVETYTAFINNWNKAKEIIKNTSQSKPGFARFLEAMAREHKGKFALDSLLIKPIQKFPKYEMLIQRLLKHTDSLHPDHQLLLEAQFHIHDLLLKINCTERETNEYELHQQNLKELESLVEGLMNLVVSDRQYIRHDLVTMVTTQGTRKDRALFLFSDLLVITSIKRRSGTVRKPSTISQTSVANSLEPHKYKLLMRLPLDDLEIIKVKDDSIRRVQSEIDNINEDLVKLNQINELAWSLHCPHEQLDEVIREMITTTNRQLVERQNSNSQVSYLELSLNTSNGIEVMSLLFPKNEIRASWEEAFNEAKQKLALSPNRRPMPEFVAAVPIRKTRSGLQFTCAAPTLVTTNITGTGPTATLLNRPRSCQDVWVCNSDGYVGQVCVLSLYPEPTVVSCNSVCNARILSMASIPANNKNGSSSNPYKHISYTNCKTGYSITLRDDSLSQGGGGSNIQFDSSSSSDSENEDVESEEQNIPNITNVSDSGGDSLTGGGTGGQGGGDVSETAQSTMWLGTEDGCIHMYNSSDNIRIKKNKLKIQHNSAVQCIIYLDNRVFVSLANGDVVIYTRDNMGCWNTTDPCIITIGTASMPVIRMLPYNGKLWCGCPNYLKILNTTSLQVEHSFPVSNDSNKHLSCMTLSGLGVWVSIHNSAIIKCFHANTYEMLCEVNVTPTVNKMLSSCDDIIRQHKAACLRVTALLACKDLLWVGTSAGVLLTVLIPHITQTTERITSQLTVTGLSHGHTGQVRFLTYVEDIASVTCRKMQKCTHYKYSSQENKDQGKILIISGGDGYEDFRNASVSELAGREDSTNHLLLWHV